MLPKERLAALKTKYERQLRTTSPIFANNVYLGMRTFSVTMDGCELFFKSSTMRTLFTYQWEQNGNEYNFFITDGWKLLEAQKLCPGLLAFMNEEILGTLTSWGLVMREKHICLLNNQAQTLPINSARRIWSYASRSPNNAHAVAHIVRPTRNLITVPSTDEVLAVKLSEFANRTVDYVVSPLEGVFEPDRDFSRAETEEIVGE